MRQSLRHLGQLVTIIIGIGSIHLFTILYVENVFSIHALILAYLINTLLAVAGYLLIRLAYRFKTQVEGFIFLLLSFIKFGVVYYVFIANPNLPDGESRTMFINLFVPYLSCLVWEITVLAKILNQAPKTEA